MENFEPRDDQPEKLTEHDQKLIEMERGSIAQFFDTVKDPEERKSIMIGKLKPFFDAGLMDENLFLQQIEEICAIDDKEFFVERSLDLMKLYYLARSRDKSGLFDSIRREQHGGRERINEILEYELVDDGRIIKIHTWPREKPGIKKLKMLTDSGFRELAKIIDQNEKIEKVEAWSYLVLKNKKLFEGLGFTLGEEYTTSEGIEGQGAEISREEFLKRYLK